MTDHFCRFGIDRTFAVNRDELERRFYELQLQSHPDRHVTAEIARRDEALAESSDINAAYRTLREPLPRAKHLLELYGYPISSQKKVPQTLLMTVMEAQEKIAELEMATDRATKQRMSRELGVVAEDLETRRSAIDEERAKLAKDWDKAMHAAERTKLSPLEEEHLGRMAQLISERAYLETLHWSVQAAQEGKTAFMQH